MVEVEPLRRWSEGGAGDALEQEIGELVRAMAEPDAASAAELATVRARLREPRARSAHGPGRYAVLLGVGLVTGTGFALASYGVARFIERAPESLPATPAVRAQQAGIGSAEPSGVQRTESALEPTAPAGPSKSDGTKPGGSPRASSAVGEESQLLARALSALRSERNPAAALLLLEEHAREFPAGSLRLEADVARLDALLALGRETEALRLLEILPIDRIGRGAELRVIRGELRARSDPSRAVLDFDQALAAGLAPELEERALFGRAVNRMRRGDAGGARADFDSYLARYPRGRFAAQARDAGL